MKRLRVPLFRAKMRRLSSIALIGLAVSAFLMTEIAGAGQKRPTDAELDAVDQSIMKNFPYLAEYSSAGPRCLECHADIYQDTLQSIHGKSGILRNLPKGGICFVCHENNHKIPVTPVEGSIKEKLNEELKAELQAAKQNHSQSHSKSTHQDIPCMRCHQDQLIAATFGFSQHVPSEFELTFHYRKAMLGDKRAPLCYDCHGTHSVVSVKDPSSPVNELKKAKVCARCHSGANATFAATFDHRPIRPDSKPIEYWTIVMFKTLTLGTFLALGLFIFLDVFTFIRQALTPSHKKDLHHVEPALKKKYVKRLGTHLRIQHFLMLASVITLSITGWPLLEPNSSSAHAVIRALGGPVAVPIIHRIAGIIMIGDMFYHLVFLYLRFRAGYRHHPMLPKPKDIADLWVIMLFYVGLRKTKPKFEEFSFIEKFDYWAVFWGVAMMGVSGLVLMFPSVVTRLFPALAVNLASIVHADEALLAATVLFIWHFYNVHLKPGIFPMNWAWLTGRMRADIYEEEHGAHVQTLRKQGKWDPEKLEDPGKKD